MSLARPSEKQARALVCLFFLAILLLGFFTVADYGRPWDELSEIRIFRMAVMEYADALPFDTGFRQALADMDVTPLHESVEMDHNFALYYPLAGAACDPNISLNQFALLWRLQTWLIFTLGLWSLYAICRRLGLSRPLCAAAVLLLLLSPRFFAEGHYNNKDLALMTLTGLVLWQSLRLAEKPSFPRAMLFALCAGMCVNTRIIGAAVCGLCGLMILLRLAAEQRLHGREIRVGVGALALSLACYALLTPALLRDPLGYVAYVVKNSVNFTRWNGTMLFMGRLINMSAEKPPFYYLPVNVLLTTPLPQLALTATGAAATVGRLVREKGAFLKKEAGFGALLSLLLWLLPLLGGMAIQARVYNGWRHFYFIYIPMMASAAWGLSWLAQRLRARGALRRVCAGLLALALAAQGALLGLNHPYQYSYYNALVSRADLAQRYELDYWNLSVVQALQGLLTLAGDEAAIPIACSDGFTRSGFAFATTYLTPEEDARFALLELDELPQTPYYLLVNTSYGAMAGFAPAAGATPVVEIKAYGATLCTVYRVEAAGGIGAR